MADEDKMPQDPAAAAGGLVGLAADDESSQGPSRPTTSGGPGLSAGTGGVAFEEAAGDAAYEEYDDEEDIELDPDNPLVVRIRQALTKQLEGIQGRIDGDLRIKEEELKRILRKREDVGVELYGVQQQLAKLQMTVEKTHDSFNMIVKVREQTEAERSRISSELEHKKQEIGDHRNRVFKLQGELDKLNSTLKQVQSYNDDMKGEIAVTRRAAYKAEEEITKIEKEKQQQDVAIDQLQDRIKELQTQLKLYQDQLEAQKKETDSATETLREANEAMERIRKEKHALLQQWRSALLAISRRDDQLAATEGAIRQWQEKELSIEGEITSFKKSIREDQERNEILVGQVTKVRNEAAYLERQIETIREQRDRLAQQYSMLKQSLEQTEGDLAGADKDKKTAEDEQVKLDRAIFKVSQENQAVEEKIMNQLNDQTTLEKSHVNVAKGTEKMRKEIHAKENDMAQVYNEMARIRVDTLNTVAHNDQLKATLDEVEQELQRKEALIAKYELEIRRRTDELEKKLRDLDSLNRKFETLKARFSEQLGAEAAAVGPLEATIKNLGRQIETVRKENGDLQRRWMGAQTELVQLQNDAAQQSEKVATLKAQYSVLNQKRVRMEGQVAVQEAEVKELENGIKQMRHDMSRLNDLIARNEELQKTLANENFGIEAEFVNKLKDAEEEVIAVEGQIEASKASKAQILEEILEVERQVLLVERKIELEKETQAAYNQEDETGAVIKGMKKEIHRMELRHTQLLGQQEELMKEVERSISKRENIAARGNVVSSKGPTAGDSKREMQQLEGKAKDMEREAERYNRQQSLLGAQREEVGQKLDEIGSTRTQMQDSIDNMNKQILDLSSQRDAIYREVLRRQRTAKRFQALAQGKYTPGTDTQIEKAEEKLLEKIASVRQITDAILEEDPTIEQAVAPLIAALQ